MGIKEKNKNIDSLIAIAVTSLSELASTKTVIGQPIETSSGFQVIPISKVTMGYLSGGGEYGDLKILDEEKNLPFAGGTGAIMSMKPTGFIIDDGKTVRLVRATDDPLDSLIEKAGDILEKFTKGKEEVIVE